MSLTFPNCTNRSRFHWCFDLVLLLSVILLSLNIFCSHFSGVEAAVIKRNVYEAEDWISNLLLQVPNASEHFYEIAHVHVKSSWRRRRDTDEDTQFIQVHRPSKNSSLFIKLERKQLLSPTFSAKLPNEFSDKFNVDDFHETQVFSGEIMPDLNVTHATPLGSAALSVCDSQGGLCGLIVSEKEHLFIQPRPIIKSVSTDGKTIVLENEYVLATVPENLASPSCTLNDELRVPVAKLAAAAEAEIHQKQSSGRTESSQPKRQSTLLIPLASESGSSESGTRPRTYAGGRKSYRSRTRAVPLATTTVTGKKVVEIAVFTDQDLYEKLRKRFPKDTVQKIKDYVITMINTMDLLYRHKSLGVDVEFSLVHLEIMKKYPSKLNKNGGKAMAYLTSFCEYAGEKNINSELWDHALLLTGTDLKEDGTSSTAGLAWAGTMCYRYYSCSISEGHSFGTAYIITHEIGHSLGMEHDGMGVSKTCDRDKYLMSPTTGPGKVEWSVCSRQNLVEFLTYGSSELRNSNRPHKPTCLNESKRSTNKIDVKADINNLPGKKYDATQQCVLAMGSKFKPVLRKSEPPFDVRCLKFG